MKNDPFGLAIADYWQKPNQRAIHIHLNGRKEPSMNASYFFRTYSTMKKVEKLALQHCRGHVLDVGAAAGAHSMVLAKRGFQITSLDSSAYSCAVMKQRGLTHVVHANVEQYHAAQYDTILLLMNGFGIAGTAQQLPHFLNHLKKLLLPGGQILGDSTDISYYLEEHPTPATKSPFNACDVTFHVKYKEHETMFPWTYPNTSLLSTAASACGLKTEIITQVASGGFLAKLT